MRDDADVLQALLHRKGWSVSDFARELGLTRQHAHRMLTASEPIGDERDEIETALALGSQAGERPFYAVGELDEFVLDLIPAGDAQPLFADRELATAVAEQLEDAFPNVCVIPVWPSFAWQSLVSFHAAWDADPEPRKVFVADGDVRNEVPLEAIVAELVVGLEATLKRRARAGDPALIEEVTSRLSGYTDARLPQ